MLKIAVIDTCALFSASLRDILLWAAKTELYDIRITDEILEELRRTLMNKRNKSEQQVQRLVSAIKVTFPLHFVENYQWQVEQMPINEKDRHVLAAAVVCNAQIIVTRNLKHFPPYLLAPYEMEAQLPDKFLLQLFAENPEGVVSILIKQAAGLRNPPLTVLEVLDRLELEAPHFVRLVRELF